VALVSHPVQFGAYSRPCCYSHVFIEIGCLFLCPLPFLPSPPLPPSSPLPPPSQRVFLPRTLAFRAGARWKRKPRQGKGRGASGGSRAKEGKRKVPGDEAAVSSGAYRWIPLFILWQVLLVGLKAPASRPHCVSPSIGLSGSEGSCLDACVCVCRHPRSPACWCASSHAAGGAPRARPHAPAPTPHPFQQHPPLSGHAQLSACLLSSGAPAPAQGPGPHSIPRERPPPGRTATFATCARLLCPSTSKEHRCRGRGRHRHNHRHRQRAPWPPIPTGRGGWVGSGSLGWYQGGSPAGEGQSRQGQGSQAGGRSSLVFILHGQSPPLLTCLLCLPLQDGSIPVNSNSTTLSLLLLLATSSVNSNRTRLLFVLLLADSPVNSNRGGGREHAHSGAPALFVGALRLSPEKLGQQQPPGKGQGKGQGRGSPPGAGCSSFKSPA